MTEIPDRVMLDNDALNCLQENDHLLSAVTKAKVDIYVSVFQYNEFTDYLADLPPEKRDRVPNQIEQVLEKADLETTTIETSGYGEAYGHNYTGATGEIYKKLTQPHPNIRKVDHKDAIGAEAAINRKMPFVTGDTGLKDKMRESGYQEYLLPLDRFCGLLEG